MLDFGLAKLTEAVAPEDDATATLHAVPAAVTEQGAIIGAVSGQRPARWFPHQAGFKK